MDFESATNATCKANSTCSVILAVAKEPAVEAASDEAFLLKDVGWFCYKDDCRVLQPVWKLFLTVLGRSGIEHPMSVALMPLAFYLIMVSILTVFDLCGKNWHWVQKYKLQSNKIVKPKVVWKAVKMTFWNHLLLFAPIFMVQYITNQPSIIAVPLAPGLLELVGQVSLMMVLFDFQYFTWHYLHHRSRRLYKWAHILHHEFSSPSAWSTQYLHPWELFCVGVYNGLLPVMIDCHWLTSIVFSLSNVYLSVMEHSGYTFPIDSSRILPGIFGGSPKHDMHHMKPYTNFQPFFCYFDILFGTDCPGLLPGNKKSKALIEWEKNREAKASSWHKEHPVRDIELDN